MPTAIDSIVERALIPSHFESEYLLQTKAAMDNPDLPMSFIRGITIAKKEIDCGDVSDFKFR